MDEHERIKDRLRIQEEQMKDRCNLEKHTITYCVDYKKDICPLTCYYAIQRGK